MSDIMVLMERYLSFMAYAAKLQDIIDAIERADPDQGMLAMECSIKARKGVVLADCESIRMEMMDMLEGSKHERCRMDNEHRAVLQRDG